MVVAKVNLYFGTNTVGGLSGGVLMEQYVGGAARTPGGWTMLKSSGRRVSAAIGTAIIAVIATLVVSVAPANAAASGYFLSKGTGSNYSKAGVINLGVVPGGAAKTFYYKIVNTSATAEIFKVDLDPAGTDSAWKLYKGTSAVPNDYVTPAIAPGNSLALKVKVALPAGTPQGEYLAYLTLRDATTNAALASVTSYAQATNQTGTSPNDLFLKTGTQPYVGGSSEITQYQTASAIRPGGTATYTLRLKNDGDAPASIGLVALNPLGCASSTFSLTIKQGTQNVTAAVQAGTYNTGTLAPGAKKELKVMVKLLSATTCVNIYHGFSASGAGSFMNQYSHTIVGA